MVKSRDEIFQMDVSPETSKESVVLWENYRFSVLTDALVRVQYRPDGKFEDFPTQTVLNRDFDSPEFKLKENNEMIEIITKKVHLIFYKSEGGFTKNNLQIEAIGNYSLYHSTWYFGDTPETLKGTARTLDFIDGATELEEGLMNKNGFAIIDDSDSMKLTDTGWVERREKEAVDIYFFGYGRDYLRTLKDYHYLTGKTPLIPRYALGNWWSRYYPYSEESYKELMNQFKEKEIPFSVAVIDMDWHITDVPDEYGSGWTGYTWNTDLFPDPEKFLSWLHDEGMAVTLNLHPANGVQPFEEQYEPMAKELEIDYENKAPIHFDIADSEFLNAYFEYLHHPHEEIGVDFWWIDWQQGSVTKVEGLDPLWMLNHYHFLDHGRGDNRPFIFSRYAGLGSHRYPIGFSGDTAATWDSLEFQPYFTATATNVGYSWWSHDIGGHMGGEKDNELFVRWVQFGVFSPINRLHSQSGAFSGKEPWRYGRYAEGIVADFMRLRHRMIPYLYTMNVLNHTDDFPLIRPMYYHNPWKEEAYQVKNQYYFGTQMFVAPITTKIKDHLRLAKVKTWFPEGHWIDFFTGRVYEGGRTMDIYRPLSSMPVFAKAGAIIPLDKEFTNDTSNPERVDVKIFPGADGSFSLYEDDGIAKVSDGVTTRMKLQWNSEDSEGVVFTIDKPEGPVEEVLSETRQYRLSFVSLDFEEDPTVKIDGEEIEVELITEGRTTYMDLPESNIQSTYSVAFEKASTKVANMHQELYKFLDRAQLPDSVKEQIFNTVKDAENSARAISGLLAMDIDRQLLEALSEIIWANPDEVGV